MKSSIDPTRIAAQVSYHDSGRHFTMQNAQEVEVEIDTCSWASIGGVTVNIYSSDSERSVAMAFGFDAFLEIVDQAVRKFANLDIAYASEDGSEGKLQARNDFLRGACEKNPALLAEASCIFRRFEP